MKGNQRKNKEFGHVGAGQAAQLRDKIGDRVIAALTQPEPSGLPFISQLSAPAIEPMIALPCWVMTPGMDDKPEWISRELRFLPSQVEQYYQGAVYKDSTCLVMKSGNIILCELSVDSYEAAIMQYMAIVNNQLQPVAAIKPTL